MINKINLHRLRTHEAVQFFSDFENICTQNAIDKLKIGNHFTTFQQTFTSLEASNKSQRVNELTQELVVLNERRERALLFLKKMINGYSYHFNPQKEQAAEKLKKCFESYGGRIYDMNYKAETRVISKLGKDLNNGLLKEVDSLGLKEVLNEMLEANTLFNETFLDRVEENAENHSSSTSKLVKVVIGSYNELCRYIEANLLLHPGEQTEILSSQINSLIEDYNNTLALRNHSKQVNEDVDENEEV